MNFESKMASATNVIILDCRMMAVALLMVTLTQNFSSTLLLLLPTPASLLFYGDMYIFLLWLIALTTTTTTYIVQMIFIFLFRYSCISSLTGLLGANKMTTLQLACSSIGRALYWYCRVHGLKSCISLNFFCS